MRINKEIEFPDCWEEVQPVEWMYLLQLRNHLIRKKGVTLADVKMEWCRYVISNRGLKARGRNDYYLLVYNLAKTLAWMWQENEDGTVELTFNSTVNLMPVWKHLRGPLSHGGDMTFGEFRSAVVLLNTYNQTGDTEALTALAGMLYRLPGKRLGKANFDGKYREEFRPERMEYYAKRAKKMPEWVKWGIYAWFAYFCDYLITESFIVEGSEVNFSPIFERGKADTTGDTQSIGMNSILFTVAESGIFGNAEKTDETLLLKVMLKLLDDKQRGDAMTKRG